MLTEFRGQPDPPVLTRWIVICEGDGESAATDTSGEVASGLTATAAGMNSGTRFVRAVKADARPGSPSTTSASVAATGRMSTVGSAMAESWRTSTQVGIAGESEGGDTRE